VPVPPNYTEEGIASWYGVPYHGRRAANGEIYDMYKLTAAHRTLPFETVVRVTNLRNGKQVDVRITDRGPFVEGRIIDLSLGAARELDMVGVGIAPVRLALVSALVNPASGFFTVQVGAFLSRDNAERLRRQMEERYSFAVIQEYDAPQGLFYRVRVGKLTSEDAAKGFAEQLRQKENVQPFVVRLDTPAQQ
jgi:rare lipoprotein A